MSAWSFFYFLNFSIAFFKLLNVLLANRFSLALRSLHNVPSLIASAHILDKVLSVSYCMRAILKLSSMTFENDNFGWKQFADYHFINYYVLAQQEFLSIDLVLFLLLHL